MDTNYRHLHPKPPSERPHGSESIRNRPRYDDAGLTNLARESTDYREIPRENLFTYKRMQAACLGQAVPPEIVVITSFNEFHENTHIEPSQEFGSAYLELTRKFSDELHRWGGPTHQTYSLSSLKKRG